MRSNLDVYAIQNDKEETRIALSGVKRDSLGNILYTNCVCRFKIGDTIVKNIRYDMCFYSEESDVIVFFAKGKISQEEVEAYLDELDIKYTTISFLEDNTPVEDDDGELEIWFAREAYVLEDAIDASLEKKLDMCLYYPGEKSTLYVGYKTSEGKFVSIDGRICQGTIVFKDKLVLLISQKDPRNITPTQAMKILEEKGVVVLDRREKDKRRR